MIQHGLLDASNCWIANEPNASVAFMLAKQGYDVWLGNNRGNLHSPNNTRLNPQIPDQSDEYYNYSFSTLGKHDLPRQIDYVLEQTGVPNLSYMGHSQGTS